MLVARLPTSTRHSRAGADRRPGVITPVRTVVERATADKKKERKQIRMIEKRFFLIEEEDEDKKEQRRTCNIA